MSAAVSYDFKDDSRRTRPLRTAARPNMSAAGRVVARPFRARSEPEALYFAGAALAALDSFVRSDPPWGGVWRRLALKCAAAVAANLLNRREDEFALRDVVALAKPPQALGPAGRVYAAFRVLAGPGDPFRPERLAAVAADLHCSRRSTWKGQGISRPR